METKKIKSINATRFNQVIRSFNDQEIDVVEVPSSYKEFDPEGNLICEISYNAAGDVAEKVEYDFKENLLVEKRIFLDEHEVAEKRNYFYRDSKNIEYVIVSYTDNTVERIDYKYDVNNNLIAKVPQDDEGGHEEMGYKNGMLVYHKITDDFGEIEKEETREYDASNKFRLAKISRYEDGVLMNVEVIFDENELIKEEKSFDEDGNLVGIKTFKYDSNSNLTEVYTNAEEGKTWLKMEYDEQDNEILQYEIDEENEVHFRVERKYDENKNVVSAEVEINNFGRAINSHYTIEYNYLFY